MAAAVTMSTNLASLTEVRAFRQLTTVFEAKYNEFKRSNLVVSKEYSDAHIAQFNDIYRSVSLIDITQITALISHLKYLYSLHPRTFYNYLIQSNLIIFTMCYDYKLFTKSLGLLDLTTDASGGVVVFKHSHAPLVVDVDTIKEKPSGLKPTPSQLEKWNNLRYST